jgi:hypothetical protein
MEYGMMFDAGFAYRIRKLQADLPEINHKTFMDVVLDRVVFDLYSCLVFNDLLRGIE